jgi:hypothetical protein
MKNYSGIIIAVEIKNNLRVTPKKLVLSCIVASKLIGNQGLPKMLI